MTDVEPGFRCHLCGRIRRVGRWIGAGNFRCSTCRRLTPSQKDIYQRIVRRSAWRAKNGRDAFVTSTEVGSRGGCMYLIRKGWITQEVVYGPRGGTSWRYRTTADPIAEAQRLDAAAVTS